MIVRWIFILCFLVPLVGCSNEKERNRNRDLDRPQVGEKEKGDKNK